MHTEHMSWSFQATGGYKEFAATETMGIVRIYSAAQFFTPASPVFQSPSTSSARSTPLGHVPGDLCRWVAARERGMASVHRRTSASVTPRPSAGVRQQTAPQDDLGIFSRADARIKRLSPVFGHVSTQQGDAHGAHVLVFPSGRRL